VLGPRGELAFIIHRVEDVTEYVRMRQTVAADFELDALSSTQRMEAEIIKRGLELQDANRRLRATEEELRDADRRKDEFLAVLAHELRNPLAPIRNALHIMRLTGGRNPGSDGVGEMIERQVNHMVRLVDDLLEVSRVTRGKIELRKSRIDVATVVRNAIETSRPVLESAGHALELDLPESPLVLEGDLVRLTQIVANLLNNAAKYTPAGGRIAVRARRDGRHAVVAVADTGIGIPPDMLRRVFEPFAQVDQHASRAQGGLGIGLTLVKRLVELHGGSVHAQSAGEGRGSEFVIRLPLAAGAAAEGRPGESAGAVVGLPAERLLVVDDNRDAADSLAALLQILGADARTAYNGPDALAAIALEKPAAVLLDLGMPGMDGHEVARQIRRQPALADVALVALTGWGQEQDRRRARDAGFDFHLVKPADLSTLHALLQSIGSEARFARAARATGGAVTSNPVREFRTDTARR
jgi:signal transduction histidine kinase/ActR/RegA family two-component response regulator